MKSVYFLLCILTFSATAAEYNERSNLVSNPYAEQNFMDWSRINADIYSQTASVGTKCFGLNPPAGDMSQVRSVRMQIDEQQTLKVGYSFKSLPGSILSDGSGYAMFRFFDKNGTNIGGPKYPLVLTQNTWQSYIYETFVPTGTVEMDIRIVVNLLKDGGAAGQFLVDDVAVYRRLYPLGLQVQPPDKLYVIDSTRLSNPAEFLLIQSLQGIAAQSKPGIYIDQGDSTYLDDLIANHGITIQESNSLYFHLDKFKGQLTGYILYDLQDKQSMLAASSLAGILRAVMVDISIEDDILNSYGVTQQPLGLTKIMDVRGRDCAWVYQNYWEHFSKNGIMMKEPDASIDPSAYYMRDMGIAQKLMWWWNSSYSLTSEVLGRLIDNSHCWGWDDPAASGELSTTQFHSEKSLYTGATAAVCNLSVLSSVGGKYPGLSLTQKIDDASYVPESNVHYVCFMMSDMDNIGTQLGAYGWHINPNYYGSPHRGQFPMGWGISAGMLELAPSVMEWWYRNATEKDSFTAACSGLGYMYASYFPDLDNHTRKTEELMTRANLRTCVISDKFWPRSMTESSYYPVAHMYSRLDPVRGMFYFDVNGDYARYGGDILWFDGKPMVTCRYTLWDASQYNGISRNAQQLAASINSRPKNPYSESGYTFVMVHAWSYGMDEVAETVGLLDSNVRVVTPVELIEQIHYHLSPCGAPPVPGDIIEDCTVDFADYRYMCQAWMGLSNGNTDLWQDGKTDFLDLAEFISSWLE